MVQRVHLAFQPEACPGRALTPWRREELLLASTRAFCGISLICLATVSGELLTLAAASK